MKKGDFLRDIVIYGVQAKITKRRNPLVLNSIQHFIENGVPNLQKASKEFSEDPRDFAGFVSRVIVIFCLGIFCSLLKKNTAYLIMAV